jgi:hypothetical protein
MLLTEYSLSNPPANKTAQIDNALTFALGKDKVWFTELTANYIGYVVQDRPLLTTDKLRSVVSN